MLSFSYNRTSQDYAARVLDAMKRNEGYIVMFNKGCVAEAKQRIFAAAMREENENYSNLDPYIKVLARHIMKSHSKDIPYAPYNEDGEVSLVFTGLIETPKFDKFDDKAQVMSALEELYLLYPEDFVQMGSLIPKAEKGDTGTIIKNKDLKQAVLNLLHNFEGSTVLYCIIEFISKMAKEKAEVVNNREGINKEVPLVPKVSEKDVRAYIGDKKWICDDAGNPVGINPCTLEMENDFNPEWHQFRLAVNTVCSIYALDISEYLNEIEEKVYVEQGVDNEYILWCGSRFKLTTPAGTSLMGRTREMFMTLVRRELITSLMQAGVGTVIAVGPETVYLRLTKASNISNLIFKSGNKSFICPLKVQKTVACRA